MGPEGISHKLMGWQCTMMNVASPALAFLPFGLILLAILYQISTARRLPLPPGPSPKLFIGNVHQLPTSESWKTYTEWSRTYGPVTYFRIFTRHMVLLNTAEAVTDLLDKRSNIYSDRPLSWMFHKLARREFAIFNLTSEHERFKKYRRMLTTNLNARATQSYRVVMESEVHNFLKGLAETPEQLVSHIRRNAGAIIMKLAYGYNVSTDDDFFVKAAKDAFNLSAKANRPGRWMVDYYHFLRFIPAWFPGGGFKREGERFRVELAKLSDAPHNWVKAQIAEGDYVDSFSSRLLKPEDGHTLSYEEDDIIKWVAGGLYVGGADTTVSALTTFFLIMCLHPDIQRRAQDEINEVVGKDRLPNVDDRNALPFVNAVIKEILRWAPVAPLGVPHALTQEDEYKGMRIPRKSVVIANIWAITHDPALYPDPFAFDPDRYTERPGHKAQPDSRDFAFGFGRRICPGAHFAEVSLFVTIASTLAVFDVGKARDAAGREIEPEVAYTSGITSHPKPFPCRISPRSEQALLLLQNI